MPAAGRRVWNFSAGPGVMPEAVLRHAQAEMLDAAGSGMSVMEMSHRSPAFDAIHTASIADLRTLLAIPDNYHVLYMQGGATAQFAAVYLNLVGQGDTTTPVDYVVTGVWSDKAAKEAQALGAHVRRVTDTSADRHTTLPDAAALALQLGAAGHGDRGGKPAYVYYCDNETVHGVEVSPATAVLDHVPKDVPVVCDMSSNFLTRPIDVARYGVIYGGAQKNIGPAGVTIVIVRDDLLQRRVPAIPAMLDWSLAAKNNSLYNTPPTWAIYISGLVFKHVLAAGGVTAMEAQCAAKAARVYAAIDGSGGFYRGPVHHAARSRVNIPCRIVVDGAPAEALETQFLADAADAGLVELSGHRSVGGLRFSLYNAMPMAGVEALIAFMAQFQQKHGPPRA
ncbi:hypothetical protein CXG81DRAFT_12731 [Caulochytrium protostelioides]|uniref:Phosphoserine aminotransferase n=1 Tax=Caulochytrium protostelioides TaxID=1555241 RepID=A0A4P9X6R8_9FUNG|nr:hypothetical protein CXG81DRAFT_12731 [Caulochytrium protostelioides]|eukprot:RKP00862.1 hypothetical protein CXG81DRAFT_12731 [Caulochytrium protostelioides]